MSVYVHVYLGLSEYYDLQSMSFHCLRILMSARMSWPAEKITNTHVSRGIPASLILLTIERVSLAEV